MLRLPLHLLVLQAFCATYTDPDSDAWYRSRQYHLEALAAFQRYKAYYREEVVTLLTAQRDAELAMHMLEEAELDAEVPCCPHCPPWLPTCTNSPVILHLPSKTVEPYTPLSLGTQPACALTGR